MFRLSYLLVKRIPLSFEGSHHTLPFFFSLFFLLPFFNCSSHCSCVHLLSLHSEGGIHSLTPCNSDAAAFLGKAWFHCNNFLQCGRKQKMRPKLYKNSALLSRVVFKRDILSIKPRIVNDPTLVIGHTDPPEVFKVYKLFSLPTYQTYSCL